MSNDELLDRIDNALESNICYERLDGIVIDMYPRNFEIDLLFKALRAVVELHKPVQGSSDIQTYDYVGCDACVEWSHDGNMNLRYPCPTIQAIEKELK